MDSRTKAIVKLSKAINEALDLEKCSICLEKLEDTVMLWPCTHRFCSKCISNMKRLQSGESSVCPLCKGAAPRRSVLPFHDKQKEYEDHLQTLIGAISLDIGFDITSYKNQDQNEISSNLRVKGKQTPDGRRTRKSSSNIRKNSELSDSPISARKVVSKRARNAIKEKGDSSLSKSSLLKPQQEPSEKPNSREEKVQTWLNSTRFSQAQTNLTETIVVDVHAAELESTTATEDQLLSVTQVESKPSKANVKKNFNKQTIDIDAIEPYESVVKDNNPTRSEKNQRPSPTNDDFDKLLPQVKKLQVVKTTYGNKNQKKEKCYTVDSDIFKSFNDCKNESKNSHSGDNLDSSQKECEDFSSGSGEEWTLDKDKKDKFKTKKLKTAKNGKSLKKSAKKETISKKTRITRKSSRFSNPDLEGMKDNKQDTAIPKHKGIGSSFGNCKGTTGNSLKDIIDEWDDPIISNKSHKSKEECNSFEKVKFPIPNLTPAKEGKNNSFDKLKILPTFFSTKQTQNDKKKLETPLPKSTPTKQSVPRSPGWSKLSSTKKEFHMSERKKLSLKTCSKVKPAKLATPSLSVSNAINDRTINVTNLNTTKNELEVASLNKEDNSIEHQKDSSVCNLEKSDNGVQNKTLTISKESNQSVASSSPDPPFFGFDVSTNIRQPVNENHLDDTPNPAATHILSGCPLNDLNDKLEIITANDQEQIYAKNNENVMFAEDIDDYFCPIELKGKLTSTPKIAEKNQECEPIIHKDESTEITNNTNNKNYNNKRSRDSGIQDESFFCSPARKKVCRDVEVQTSPGRMKDYIKEMVESMWGTVEGSMINKWLFNTRNIESHVNQEQAFHDAKTQKVLTPLLNRLSQSSDKENMEIINKNRSPSQDSFNNSDFVMGTEDCHGILVDSASMPGRPLKSHVDRNNAAIELKIPMRRPVREEPWCDPDAPTQPYKTPVVQKRVLNASSPKVYSTVSNPTDSELKKLDIHFDESLVELIDTSAISKTPWEQSGICPLDDFTSNNKQTLPTEVNTPTQSLRDKTNRTRRHLEFIGEESNSNDMFNTVEEKNNENLMEPGDNEMNNDVLKDKGVSEDPEDVIPATPTGSKSKDDGNNGVVNIEIETNYVGNEMEIAGNREEVTTPTVILSGNDDEQSVASSDDCIIEGTPDVSQADMNELRNTELENNGVTEIKTMENPTNKTPHTEKHIGLEVKSACQRSKEKEEPINENQMRQNNLDGEDDSNKEEEDDEQLCFASSLLNAHQKQILTHVLEGLGIPYSKNMGQHVSHLVVGSTNGRTQNTYKFLHAVALHKAVITFDWVVEVLSAGQAVPLDPFLALDQSGECGVLRAKLDTERVLMQDFAVHIYNVIPNLIKKEEIEELVRLCGGIVVSEINDFHKVPRDKFRVVILSEPPIASAQQELSVKDFRQTFHATEVSVDWLYNTVARYSVLPLPPFMMDPEEGVKFLLEEGYPEQLIYDSHSQTVSPTLG